MAQQSFDYSVCKTVKAPSPDKSGGLIDIAVSVARVRQLAAAGRNNDIFAMFYNLCGVVPPVNNIGYHEQGDVFPDAWGGLKHSHVIFKGLQRPFHEENGDSIVYIYGVKPGYVYKYEPNMACVARRIDAPRNALFVAYVVFENNDFEKGEVLNWEWVTADSQNPNYPEDFANRYKEKVWENE